MWSHPQCDHTCNVIASATATCTFQLRQSCSMQLGFWELFWDGAFTVWRLSIQVCPPFTIINRLNWGSVERSKLNKFRSQIIQTVILLINFFPIIPAKTGFCGSPLYRPLSPSVIALWTAWYWPPDRTMCLDKSIYCAHKTMKLHSQTLSTMFTITNNFCACQSSPFTDIRVICSVFVEFITPSFQVLMCFNGCFGLRQRCGLTWLGCPMSTVIRVTLTALLLRCPWQWQQRLELWHLNVGLIYINLCFHLYFPSH